jgi:hypothetical protein
MKNTKLNMFVSLFNEAISTQVILNCCMGRMCDEAAVAYFNVLHGGTYGSHETL